MRSNFIGPPGVRNNVSAFKGLSVSESPRLCKSLITLPIYQHVQNVSRQILLTVSGICGVSIMIFGPFTSYPEVAKNFSNLFAAVGIEKNRAREKHLQLHHRESAKFRA